jgi:hypothetical protein
VVNTTTNSFEIDAPPADAQKGFLHANHTFFLTSCTAALFCSVSGSQPTGTLQAKTVGSEAVLSPSLPGMVK